jgi:hypothetical protein
MIVKTLVTLSCSKSEAFDHHLSDRFVKDFYQIKLAKQSVTQLIAMIVTTLVTLKLQLSLSFVPKPRPIVLSTTST